MVRKKVQSEHYVNNKEFLDRSLVVFKGQCAVAKEKGEPRPVISNYIGECFLKIATHLSYKPNFVNYMFREDMICDGIENCVQYIENFNLRNPVILLHTLHKLFTMHSCVGSKRKKDNLKSKTRF